MKKFLARYVHGILALYLFVYLAFFFLLEKKIVEFTPLNSPIDNMIPFIGIFIIPYIAWFFYIGLSCVFFFFKSQRDFVKLMSFLMIGMTSYLLICYIFPNGLSDFRPDTVTTNGICGKMIRWLYTTDTSTNVFPSIHVYNSIGIHVSIMKTDKIKQPWIKYASLLLCILICLSTVFLKQHAIIDVIGGIVMGVFVYKLVYKTKYAAFLDRKTWN